MLRSLLGRDPRVLIRPVSRKAFVATMVAYLLVRVGLGLLTGDGDSKYYQGWAYGVAHGGFTNAYETTGVDYPPFVLYLFYPIGKIYEHYVPTENLERLHGTPLFVLLIKTPILVFDLALGALIYWLVARGGIWGRSRGSPAFGRFAALLYLWNPVVLVNSAYWGQVDGVHTALAIGSFAALAYRRVGRTSGVVAAGGLLAAAGLMKVLAAPLVPLLALATAARNGVRGFVLTGSSGLAVAVLVLLPFIVTGRVDTVVDRVLFANNLMAYSSCNAHNIWMLFGGWQPSDLPVAGPATLQDIGVVLFLAAYFPLLGRSLRWLRSSGAPDPEYMANLVVLAAAIGCAFFYLTTNLHSNHLFIVAPMLLIVAGRSRMHAWLAIGATVAVLLNMALHDTTLAYSLPFPLSARSPVVDSYLVFDASHALAAEQISQDLHYTWLQLVGMWFNVGLVTVVCAVTYVFAWRQTPGSSAP